MRASTGARIVAIAEEVDSRTHGLFPYTDESSFESVLDWLEESRGSLFDPQIVDAFLNLLRDRRIETSGELVPSPLES